MKAHKELKRSKAVGDKKNTKRKSGILLHPTSLPGPYGIGDLGPSAYNFIDFLEQTDQHLWQVLPLGPTSFGDSPYQSFSSFAGQPLLISPDLLIEWGLIDEDSITFFEWDPNRIDYGALIKYKTMIYKQAFMNFEKNESNTLLEEYEDFCEKNSDWLTDYSTFMAIKDENGGIAWNRWDKDLISRDEASMAKIRSSLKLEIKYYNFIQFVFYKQWFMLKDYANKKDISIIGDIPIFVAYDSADVWAGKDLFLLDDIGNPTHVAGVPPDYFSATGQLWGNPLYDWPYHKADDYKWWISRIRHNLTVYDYLRIDHFRGFEAFWKIPFPSETAIKGVWKKGPYKSLFKAVEQELGKGLPIIAEDLGIITKRVEKLRDSFKFPGMKVLQFAFEGLEDNDFLPHNYTRNSICYTGTHDNDTIVGWYKKASPESKDKVRRYMNTDGSDIAWDFIRLCLSSVSNMAIIPLQDILSLDSDARMNTPATKTGNWQWRYTEDMLTPHASGMLKYLTNLYGR